MSEKEFTETIDKFRSKNIQVFGIDINNKKIVAQTLKFIFEKYQFSNFDLNTNWLTVSVSVSLFVSFCFSSSM